MPQPSTSRSALHRFIRRGLLCLVVVGTIWTGAILWWQGGQHQVSGMEIVLCLVILPATALAGIAAFQWHRYKKGASSPAVEPMPADGPGQADAARSDAADCGLPILAAWCLTNAGNNIDYFHQALVEKKLRPLPDTALLNDDGFPLFSGRIRELDAALPDEPQHANARAAFSRTIAMLSGLVDQIAEDWPLAPSGSERRFAGFGLPILRGNEPAATSQEPRLQLQIKLVIPAAFTADELKQALDWLRQRITTLPVAAADCHIEGIPSADDTTALQLAERFRSQGGAPAALLLIAAESSLCPSTIETLEGEQRLFNNQRPHGLIPGEAAFAVLVVNRQALQFALQQPACILQRVASCRRAASADDGARPTHSSLGAVTGEALNAAGLSGEAIGAIACDADHRSSRVLECAGAMLEHTPQLDAIANRLAVNETCGHAGAASAAGSWVAGIAQVRSSGQPVLVFSVGHAFERAAAVLLPANDYAPTA